MLWLWSYGRQFSCLNFRLKPVASVGAVAKRLVCGKAAAAKRNHFATGKAKGVSSRVLNDYVIARDAKRAIVVAYYYYVVLIAH
jgi:hypothetical protein